MHQTADGNPEEYERDSRRTGEGRNVERSGSLHDSNRITYDGWSPGYVRMYERYIEADFSSLPI